MPELTETDGFFPAKDNLRLYVREIRPSTARAEVFILHGYGDHGGRYLEVMRHLAGQGYAAHALDFRGHGQADGRRGHVYRFSEYLDDLEVFLGRVKERAQGRKVFGLAHITHLSAGVAGTVLVSPYLKLAFAPPRFLAAISGLLSKTVPFLHVANPLKAEMLTRDTAIQQATQADPLYNRNTTPRWFTESNRAQLEVTLRAPEYVWPTLMLLGSADPVADPQAGRTLFPRLGSKDKELIEYPEFRHEVLNEIGRERAYADLTRWLEARS
jgi:alpha-beta hydrolase superfamily lysophospholipase